MTDVNRKIKSFNNIKQLKEFSFLVILRMSFSDTVVQGEAIESDNENDVDISKNIQNRNQKVRENV